MVIRSKVKKLALEIAEFCIGYNTSVVNLGKKFDLLLEELHISVDGRDDIGYDNALRCIVLVI